MLEISDFFNKSALPDPAAEMASAAKTHISVSPCVVESTAAAMLDDHSTLLATVGPHQFLHKPIMQTKVLRAHHPKQGNTSQMM